MMAQLLCPVIGTRKISSSIYILSFHAPTVSATVRPGQFLNIKVDEGTDPLLRRPFSVYHTEGENVEIAFNVIGKGTAALCRKRPGEMLDVLGPLGIPFSFERHDFKTGVLIGGGLGVVPLPTCTTALKLAGRKVLTFLGARTSEAVLDMYLENLQVATDDGSRGFHGTAVDLARHYFSTQTVEGPKIFACGPTAMLRAVAALARERDIPCEVSLEGAMACGFGICQGCPVELVGQEKKYALMCKDGPTFDIRTIVL